MPPGSPSDRGRAGGEGFVRAPLPAVVTRYRSLSQMVGDQHSDIRSLSTTRNVVTHLHANMRRKNDDCARVGRPSDSVTNV